MSELLFTELSPVKSFNLMSHSEDDQSFHILQPSPINEFYDIKVGYEVTVPSDLPSSVASFEYEDISEDASSDSLTYTQIDLPLTIEDEESKDSLSKFPKSIINWNSDHIMKWILDLYDEAKFRYEDLNLHFFKKRDGRFFMSLIESDWMEVDKKRSRWLYRKVQELIQQYNKDSSNEVSSTTQGFPSTEKETTQNAPRRKRGRPRSENAKRRPEQKIGRVWEFLRNLLHDPEYCPSLIYWEDYNTKKFRLVDGSKVAKLWGKKKNNPNMTYEKFSRTIRHYYKDKVILSVPKEKLVYRFGERAEGIETDNPNFGITVNLR